MITELAVDASTVNAWMTAVASAVRTERDYLSQLDAAIGDGDHGVNMNRGFDAVEKALAAQGDSVPPGQLLIIAGKTLVSTVGGASGPLWGSALRRTGRTLGDADSFDGTELVAALDTGLAAVKELGAAEAGDKTMVDAFEPALAQLRSSLGSGSALDAALAAAADAAEEGAKATVPMQARKGRASYLGERSIGHQDPGATSTALIMRALAQAVDAEQ
jgi:dihydroxyacetone kinase-like protein